MTPEQKAARRQCITATDVRGILGLCPYNSSPLSVYLDKLGLLPPIEQTEAMELGTLMQPVIRQLFERRTGIETDQADYLVTHPECRWIAATPDAFCFTGTGHCQPPAEWKYVNDYRQKDQWGESGTDKVPEFVALQNHWQQLACQAEGGYVGALICGQFRHYAIPHRPDILDMLKAACWDFFQRVQERRPPEPDWENPNTPKLVKLLHKPRTGLEVLANEKICYLVRLLEYNADHRKELAERSRSMDRVRDELQAKIIHESQDAARIDLPDGRYIERKIVTRKAYEVKGTSYETFWIETPKGTK